MPLASIEFHNIRIYEHAVFEPDSHLNLISGANASGKTTLLEAIYLLGTGRSFRTTQAEQLKRQGAPGLSIFAKLNNEGNEVVHLGFVYGQDGKKVSINGLEQSTVSNLALHLPLQVISPDTHYDFQQNSKQRRGILDWGLFHVEPDFRRLWARYQRILNQRNAALKDRRQTKACHVWDQELAEVGEKLHVSRKTQTKQLLPKYRTYCQELLGDRHQVDLVLDAGWDSDMGLEECLRQDRARDHARGFTHSGPQRADLQIILNKQASKLAASHGQFKLLVIALRMAQIRNLLESGKRNCCLLIDDLAAELDFEHRARLTRLLVNLPVQTFITTTEAALIDRGSWSSHREFHVEHGLISA